MREEIVASLQHLLAAPSAEDRGDYRWIYATLSNCTLVLGDTLAAEEYEAEFRARARADWEVLTFESGQAQALAARSAVY